MLKIMYQYREIFPHPILEDFIYCYWELQATSPLKNSFSYRVVSDGCIDILFECSKPNDIFITGFSQQYLEYSIGCRFHYIGIRFLPIGFPQLYGIPASEFTNQVK